MSREKFSAVMASPREQTQETPEAITQAAGFDAVETYAQLHDIKFSAWPREILRVAHRRSGLGALEC
jgi:broad specificity phosphatase PhoE